MAINQLNDYSVGDASIDDVMVTLDATRRGHIALTLTNMDSTGVPAIAAGSIVEVGGALFEFTTDTALSGSPSDGTVYIKLVPSGTAPTITLTPTMTNTAPTWSDAKQGWYGTLTAAGDRYVGKCVKNSSAYYGKVLITGRDVFDKSYESISTEFSTSSTTFIEPTTTFSRGIYVSEGDFLKVTYKADLNIVGGSTPIARVAIHNKHAGATFKHGSWSGSIGYPDLDSDAYQVNTSIIGGTSPLYALNGLSLTTRTTTYKTFLVSYLISIDKSGLFVPTEAVFVTSGTMYIRNRSLKMEKF